MTKKSNHKRKSYLQLIEDRCPLCHRKLAVYVRRLDSKKFIGCSGFPNDCRYSKSRTEVDFVREELGVPIEWRPNLDRKLLSVFSKCQSGKEKLYLLGAIYYLDTEGFDYAPVKYNNLTYYGLVFNYVFPCLKMGGYTPTSLAIVPQVEFRDAIRTYHHDFGIFYSMEKNPKEDEWKFEIAVEIDYYYTHKMRPEEDKRRDSIVNDKYRVLRLDEKDDPKKWFLEFESIYNSNIEKNLENSNN